MASRLLIPDRLSCPPFASRIYRLQFDSKSRSVHAQSKLLCLGFADCMITSVAPFFPSNHLYLISSVGERLQSEIAILICDWLFGKHLLVRLQINQLHLNTNCRSSVFPNNQPAQADFLKLWRQLKNQRWKRRAFFDSKYSRLCTVKSSGIEPCRIGHILVGSVTIVKTQVISARGNPFEFEPVV